MYLYIFIPTRSGCGGSGTNRLARLVLGFATDLGYRVIVCDDSEVTHELESFKYTMSKWQQNFLQIKEIKRLRVLCL